MPSAGPVEIFTKKLGNWPYICYRLYQHSLRSHSIQAMEGFFHMLGTQVNLSLCLRVVQYAMILMLATQGSFQGQNSRGHQEQQPVLISFPTEATSRQVWSTHHSVWDDVLCCHPLSRGCAARRATELSVQVIKCYKEDLKQDWTSQMGSKHLSFTARSLGPAVHSPLWMTSVIPSLQTSCKCQNLCTLHER